MRERLESLARLLHENGEGARAAMVDDVLAGPAEGLDAFLSSNDLWGGTGSIADCVPGGERSAGCRRIEQLLIQLGREQILTGKVNPRTEMWVAAFSKWEEAGI